MAGWDQPTHLPSAGSVADYAWTPDAGIDASQPGSREELRRLSARFRVTAALSGVIDDRITLVDLVAPARARPGVEVGQSYPFAPPVGLMFVLWDDEAERNWLGRSRRSHCGHVGAARRDHSVEPVGVWLSGGAPDAGPPALAGLPRLSQV